MSIITLIGLGPGDPALLTHAAWMALAQAPLIVSPTPAHPALAHLSPTVLHPLPAEMPAALALVQRVAQNGAVVCALPGHPSEHALTVSLRQLQATDTTLTIQIIPGVSLRDTLCDALEPVNLCADIQLVNAMALITPADTGTDTASPAWCEMQGIGGYAAPLVPYPLLPTRPALIWISPTWLHEAYDAAWLVQQVQTTLRLRYPATHPLRLARLNAQGQAEWIWNGTLADLTVAVIPQATLACYLPALPPSADQRGLDGLVWVVTRLLGPGGCPWDREQTHQTLRAGLLEEVYEVLEALDAGDMPALSEELGDLLLQVLVHSEMARQAGHFHLGDMLEQISAKLIRRHPHVFGDLVVAGTDMVLHNWEQIKAQELAAKGRQRSGALDGVPPGLPALPTAQKLVTKAARAGFDWSTIGEVWAKVHEELAELAEVAPNDDLSASSDQARIEEEFGDLLFATANLARWLNLDAESVLRQANAKFCHRFAQVERLAHAKGYQLPTLTVSELEALWQQARRET